MQRETAPPPPRKERQVAEPAPPKRPPAAPVQRRTQTSAAPRTTTGRQPEIDLDELARRLIGPLTRLLRAELRLDRERVGRLRDPRTY
ncbi:hypothetical protein [Actinomadura chibensis]|uniref:Extensin n=1 Tax=Actinomadura chibensis TaxID=392828 RepID=A0A5D0NI16_9ACTN|nr:hypothetical protein [Actinomadura chibensis]TYB44067.1 hypothetical protein FXF69_24225 [Actinomadura chibensis]